MKRIIFVDDDTRVLEGLRRLMRGFRSQWQMEFYDNPLRALEQIEKQPPDVVVSDIRMPVMDGAELLTQVQERAPATIRIALSGQCDRAAVMRAIKPTHQFLAKPCEPEMLRKTLTRLSELRDRVINEEVRAEISRIAALPVIPETLVHLRRVLTQDDVSIGTVARLMASDVGMCAKVMQLVSSNFFGTQRSACLPEESVRALGIDVIRPLVLSQDLFTSIALEEDLSHLGRFYNRLCQTVARAARRIAEMENAGEPFCTYSYLGGLFAKVGVIIYAALDITKYQQIFRLAVEGHGSLRQLETQVYGVARTQAGAYLFALWGLPEPVVDAVMYADRPSASPVAGFTPTTAVHVAEVLVQRLVGSIGGGQPFLNQDYLRTIGLEDRLKDWEKEVEQVVEETFRDEEREGNVSEPVLQETATE